MKSLKKILRIGGFENLSFFEWAILNFFLLHFHENKSVKVYLLARLGQNFDQAKRNETL
jgi:hypothetical protein